MYDTAQNLRSKKVLYGACRIGIFFLFLCVSKACGIYSFRDASIPLGVKTIKISTFDNRAAIVNAQLANDLTNRFKTKVQQQTKLTLLNAGRADYEVSGYIARYEVTTSGIDDTRASQNQLNLSVHIEFVNNVEDKYPDIQSFETDITLFKQFSAQLSLHQAEQALLPSLASEATDLLFNRIFSNW